MESKLGHFLWKDEWKIMQNGDLVNVNKQKIEIQSSVLKLVVKRMSKNFLAGKSRASWAVPLPVASQGRPVGHVLSTGFLAYPSEVDLSGGHHDFAG